MNQFSQFRATVNGVGVHFIHERGVGDDPLPIILTHGYPDSILRFAKIIPMLTHPEAHGADPSDAFHVVAPSLPGFGFSDKPVKPGAIFRVGDLWHTLMTEVLTTLREMSGGGVIQLPSSAASYSDPTSADDIDRFIRWPEVDDFRPSPQVAAADEADEDEVASV